jgi:hypothetical protein
MIVGAEPGSLKGTKLHEHALRFAFGGACTVLAGLIAQRYGPAVGGLFLAFPAIFPAGASLIVKHEEEKKQEIGSDGTRRGRILAGIDAKGAALGALALGVFALVVWRGLGSGGTAETIAVAGTAWVFAAAALWGLYRLHRAERLRRARRRHKGLA